MGGLADEGELARPFAGDAIVAANAIAVVSVDAAIHEVAVADSRANGIDHVMIAVDARYPGEDALHEVDERGKGSSDGEREKVVGDVTHVERASVHADFRIAGRFTARILADRHPDAIDDGVAEVAQSPAACVVARCAGLVRI